MKSLQFKITKMQWLFIQCNHHQRIKCHQNFVICSLAHCYALNCCPNMQCFNPICARISSPICQAQKWFYSPNVYLSFLTFNVIIKLDFWISFCTYVILTYIPAKLRASSVGTDLSDSRSVLLPTNMTTILASACSYSSFSQRSTLS